jgi:hypothetical protein
MTKNKFDALIDIIQQDDIPDDFYCILLGRKTGYKFQRKEDVVIFAQSIAYRYFSLNQDCKIHILINQMEDTIAVTKKIDNDFIKNFRLLEYLKNDNCKKLGDMFCLSDNLNKKKERELKEILLNIFSLMLNV